MVARITRNPALDEICFAEGHDWDGASSYLQGDWSCCRRCGLYANGRQFFADEELRDGAVVRTSNRTIERDVIDGSIVTVYEPQAITAELDADRLAA